jgi:hypothetical protein
MELAKEGKSAENGRKERLRIEPVGGLTAVLGK